MQYNVYVCVVYEVFVIAIGFVGANSSAVFSKHRIDHTTRLHNKRTDNNNNTKLKSDCIKKWKRAEGTERKKNDQKWCNRQYKRMNK